MVPDNAPPSKASLLKWWSQFTHPKKSPEYNQRTTFSLSLSLSLTHPCTATTSEHHPVFAKPLKDSLRRASVQISTANANGVLYVWGYIPVVVAKWSVSLPPLPRPTHSPSAVSTSRKTVLALSHRPFPTHHSQLPRSKAPFVSTVPLNACANYRPHSRHPLACVLLSPPLLSHSSPSLVRKIPRLEKRTLHHPRRRQRISTISHPDARKFRPSDISSFSYFFPDQEPVIPHDMYHNVSLSSSPSLSLPHLFKFRDVLGQYRSPPRPLPSHPHQQNIPSTVTTSSPLTDT